MHCPSCRLTKYALKIHLDWRFDIRVVDSVENQFIETLRDSSLPTRSVSFQNRFFQLERCKRPSSPTAPLIPSSLTAVYPPTQLPRQLARDADRQAGRRAGGLLEDAPLVSSNFICDSSSSFFGFREEIYLLSRLLRFVRQRGWRIISGSSQKRADRRYAPRKNAGIQQFVLSGL